MQALRLHVIGSFNSFRMPQEMRYHGTYLFPPKTTLVGLLGAALGLEDRKLGRLYDSTLIGIVMEKFEGRVRDLWRITKLKRTEAESAVIVREMLFNPVYWFYLSSSLEEYQLEKLKKAFYDPVYPLTLGRSDELVSVRSIEIVNLQEAENDMCYKWTVLPFDYREKKYKFEEIDFSKPITVPQVFQLPRSFEYGRDKRVPENVLFCTHVYDVGVRFDECRGWRDGDRCFFMY